MTVRKFCKFAFAGQPCCDFQGSIDDANLIFGTKKEFAGGQKFLCNESCRKGQLFSVILGRAVFAE